MRRRFGESTSSPRAYGRHMITAVHNLIYSDDPAATRAFFRDVLQWPFVVDADASEEPEPGADAWLIFRSGPSELGVHPTSGEGYSSPRHHAVSLMCDDLRATMDELASRGATFTSDPVDHGYGIVVMVAVPGADDMQLYEPRHAIAHSLG